MMAVLMTCHNRRDGTLACLRALRSTLDRAGASARVYLVDDGSTDGTSNAVLSQFPEVQLIRGDGSLFWNHGMRRAFQAAISVGYPMYLWLNDDTILNEDAAALLLSTHHELEAAGDRLSIVVGATHDPESHQQTYGGVVHSSRWHPLRLRLVEPGTTPRRSDTFFGNCVLIPAEVAERVGNLDPVFRHNFGDIDYGFRASKKGCTIWTAPGYVGSCRLNPVEGTWEDRSLTARERWQAARSPKGLPPREWKVVLRRQAPVLWPFYVVLPYVKIPLQTMARHLGRAL
jgi:GT2 family glycosyltransferase